VKIASLWFPPEKIAKLPTDAAAKLLRLALSVAVDHDRDILSYTSTVSFVPVSIEMRQSDERQQQETPRLNHETRA
jgi:hypothetical protein